MWQDLGLNLFKTDTDSHRMAGSGDQMNGIGEDNSVESVDSFDDVDLSREGISLLLNNKFEEAFKLFEKNK